YVKNPREYVFNSEDVDREPYMAPGLVTAEKAARGKLPTDVWWHTIVPTTGREHRDSILTPEERESDETMMICVSRSLDSKL
ncbi:hypothetical protein, partial [Bacillus sp. SIMBA_005]|uniref:hypothetical protein n=1 Tax=Bacillus sp. SIMBA_005 TaxID=3085754 RepID=UPI00397AA95B